MTRVLSVILLGAWLAGCGAFPPAPPPELPKPQAAEAPDGCKAVAEERAQDAVWNGFDETMGHRIYRATYQDCVTTRVRYRPVVE
jgi:hypothetical protein